jgi:regulator of sigma E protease
MSIAIAILGLAFLVLIHECGHFFASLAVGMRPRKFYVGFPPAILKTKRNGIEYGLGAIPLGGYVRIPGMHRPAAKDVDLVFSRALHAAPELVGPAERLKRSLAAEDYETAKVRLDEFHQRALELDVPSIEKQVTDLEDALSPQAYWRAPTWKRVTAIAAGPLTNLVFAVALFAIIFSTSAGKVTTTVDRVLPTENGKTAPARQAKLLPGDSIAAIRVDQNWTVVDKPSDITDTISGSKGHPIALLVSRNNRPVTLGPVRPLRTGSDNVYRLGFQLKAEALAFGPALWESVKTTGSVSRDTVKALGGIFRSKERSQIGGPVGISRAAADSVHYGWASYLSVLAFISLSLALLNLLPLLPLDGGHIAFSLLEGIRGRAIAREVYERVSAVGIAIVLLLFVVGLSNDVGRLGGG